MSVEHPRRPRPCSTGSNLSGMSTYTKCVANPCVVNTCKIIELKVSWNEHLQKIGGGEVLLLPSSSPRREGHGNRITSLLSITYVVFARSFVEMRRWPSPRLFKLKRSLLFCPSAQFSGTLHGYLGGKA